MATVEDQYDVTIAKVQIYAQTNVHPTLDTDDVQLAVNDALQATVWAIGTAYTYGQVVLPTVRNGHRYKCVQSGTSEALLADQPEWPTLQGMQISEGASDPLLTWEEDGPDFDNVFTLRNAIHNAWMMKAGKASLSVDIIQRGGGGLSASQAFDHCIAMAEKYGSIDQA